ncbi:hypothetical protein GS640_01455, partial [Rhodococcus hoagii]|nr:hypothetical protein [Prescottella equi]
IAADPEADVAADGAPISAPGTAPIPEQRQCAADGSRDLAAATSAPPLGVTR